MSANASSVAAAVAAARKNRIVVDGEEYSRAEWSAYTHDPLATLTAGLSLGATIQIDKKSDFEIYGLSYIANIAGAAQEAATRVIPLVRVQFNDSGSQQNWFLKPVPLDAVAGTGQLPGLLLQRRIIFGNSSMTVEYTNDSAATDYDGLQLVLIGRKLFGGPVRG